MRSRPLFNPGQRDDDAYKRAGETMHAFLDRVRRPELAAPREVLNAWFERWPTDGREELRARLTSKSPANFDSAFWELYLHEIHLRLGFEIAREPEVPGRRTRPDFLMERADGAFYLEATVVGQPASVVAMRRREEHVIEQINHAYHPDLVCASRGCRQDGSCPRVGRSSLRSSGGSGRWIGRPSGRSSSRAARALTSAAAISSTSRCEARTSSRSRGHALPRCAGSGPSPPSSCAQGRAACWNEPPAILDDLKDKARKFGTLEKSCVIAVLSRRDFMTDLDVEQALFGPEVVRIPVGPDGPVGDPRLDREPRGFWQHDASKQATRVSAVLSATNLHPWAVDEVPRLWRNPWAALPVVASLPWTTIAADSGTSQLVRHEATIDARELLGLPPN
jgi:hypothetical protein